MHAAPHMNYHDVVLIAERIFEVAGILAMLVGGVLAAVRWFSDRSYHELRRRIAHAILLGLELLIAADIIATVSTRPELDSVAALGLIIIARTFLSFTLELEATGRWPWQRDEGEATEPDH